MQEARFAVENHPPLLRSVKSQVYSSRIAVEVGAELTLAIGRKPGTYRAVAVGGEHLDSCWSHGHKDSVRKVPAVVRPRGQLLHDPVYGPACCRTPASHRSRTEHGPCDVCRGLGIDGAE